MKEKKKAQDIFDETNFVFGTKTTFDKAFPEIKNINIEVIEIGLYMNESRISHYGKTNTSEYVNCTVPGVTTVVLNGKLSVIWSIKRNGKRRSAECQGNEGRHKVGH